MRLLHSFIYSNFFIATVLLFFTLNTYFFFGLKPDLVYLVFIAFSSLSLYGIHGIIGLNHIAPIHRSNRHDWIARNKLLTWILVFVSSSVSLIALLSLEIQIIVLLIPCVILGFLYAIPILGLKRLRDLPYFKIFIISGVVLYLCCIIPVLGNELSLVFFLERFLFLIALTIPFDIRDLQIDASNGDKTTATVLGAQTSTSIGVVLLFLVIILNLILLFNAQVNLVYALVQISIAAMAILLSMAQLKRNFEEWHYALAFEGSLLLPGLLLSIYFL